MHGAPAQRLDALACVASPDGSNGDGVRKASLRGVGRAGRSRNRAPTLLRPAHRLITHRPDDLLTWDGYQRPARGSAGRSLLLEGQAPAPPVRVLGSAEKKE